MLFSDGDDVCPFKKMLYVYLVDFRIKVVSQDIFAPVFYSTLLNSFNSLPPLPLFAKTIVLLLAKLMMNFSSWKFGFIPKI